MDTSMMLSVANYRFAQHGFIYDVHIYRGCRAEVMQVSPFVMDDEPGPPQTAKLYDVFVPLIKRDGADPICGPEYRFRELAEAWARERMATTKPLPDIGKEYTLWAKFTYELDHSRYNSIAFCGHSLSDRLATVHLLCTPKSGWEFTASLGFHMRVVGIIEHYEPELPDRTALIVLRGIPIADEPPPPPKPPSRFPYIIRA